MTLDDHILGFMFAAILALQTWQLMSIVSIKERLASLEAKIEILKEKIL